MLARPPQKPQCTQAQSSRDDVLIPQVPLVLANGLEQVEQFLLYSCDGLIDAKQLIVEVLIKKSVPMDEARQRLKESLLQPG